MRIGSQNAVCRATLFASLGWGFLTACGGTAAEPGAGGGGSGGGGGSVGGGGGATTVTAGGFAKTPQGFEHRPVTAGCENSSGCIQDSDCTEGQLCRCGTETSACVPASCRSDADCGEGLLCFRDEERDPCGMYGPMFVYRCAPFGAECESDLDCGEPSRRCAAGTCIPKSVCGRPFLVDGATRSAAAVLRADFSHRLHPAAKALSATDRDALAQYWTQVGLMEHASVAAFARFTLELLSFGAPADLVAASNAALADELEHARLAFGLAGAYRGERVGPGPLSIDRALTNASFVDAVRTAFLEACVGETIAAVEAREARHWAQDGAVRGALDRIAADEMRHAALGYRFIGWALETSAPEVAAALRAMILRELSLAVESSRVVAFEYEASALTEHGLLPEAARAASRVLALADVVVPAVNALLGAVATEERRAEVTPSC